jgi:hypothetical protein
MTPDEQLDEGPLSDESLVAAAEELFLELDAREAADAQPDSPWLKKRFDGGSGFEDKQRG